MDKDVIFGAMTLMLCCLCFCGCGYTKYRNLKQSPFQKAQENYADHIDRKYSLFFDVNFNVNLRRNSNTESIMDSEYMFIQ